MRLTPTASFSTQLAFGLGIRLKLESSSFILCTHTLNTPTNVQYFKGPSTQPHAASCKIAESVSQSTFSSNLGGAFLDILMQVSIL